MHVSNWSGAHSYLNFSDFPGSTSPTYGCRPDTVPHNQHARCPTQAASDHTHHGSAHSPSTTCILSTNHLLAVYTQESIPKRDAYVRVCARRFAPLRTDEKEHSSDMSFCRTAAARNSCVQLSSVDQRPGKRATPVEATPPPLPTKLARKQTLPPPPPPASPKPNNLRVFPTPAA